ncbi:MAG: NifU family protein [Bacteroidales bacterium]
MEKTDNEKKVLKALERIRPYLNADGGDIKLIELTDDLVVKVEMTGACDGCPFSMHTLKAGVEEAVRKELPDVKEVVTVNM